MIKKSFLTAGLFILALGLASFQYNVTSAGTRTLIQNLAPYRQMYTTIGDLLVAQAEPRRYGIFFSELGEPLGNQLYFEKGVTLNAPTAFTSVHDSYYRFRYGNLSSQQIFEKNINELEKYPKALAFAYCRPQDALKEPNFVGNQNPLAAGLAIKTSDYLLNSNHWLALKQFESPYGCLYAYQYNPSELSATAKWQQLNFDSPAQASIPLALAISPDVVMFDYSSLYPAEFANGVYSQWLPSGHDKAGLNVTLFSNQSRTVFLETRAIAGPSRIDSVRTLVLNDNGKISKAVINGKANLRIEIQLQAGLNQLQFYVEEPADKPPDSSDQRQLLLLLQSPHLVRA